MSLNWDITRVKGDPKEWTPEQNDSTTVIIWATMVIGMGEITEANAQDFWLRLDMYQKVTGGWTPAVTPADVRRLIGLRTNVSKETDAAFRRRMAEISADRSRVAWNAPVPGTPEHRQAQIDAGMERKRESRRAEEA